MKEQYFQRFQSLPLSRSMEKPFKEMVDLNIKTMQRFSYLTPVEFLNVQKPEHFMERNVDMLFQNGHEALDYMQNMFQIMESHFFKASDTMKNHAEEFAYQVPRVATGAMKDARSSMTKTASAARSSQSKMASGVKKSVSPLKAKTSSTKAKSTVKAASPIRAKAASTKAKSTVKAKMSTIKAKSPMKAKAVSSTKAKSPARAKTSSMKAKSSVKSTMKAASPMSAKTGSMKAKSPAKSRVGSMKSKRPSQAKTGSMQAKMNTPRPAMNPVKKMDSSVGMHADRKMSHDSHLPKTNSVSFKPISDTNFGNKQ